LRKKYGAQSATSEKDMGRKAPQANERGAQSAISAGGWGRRENERGRKAPQRCGGAGKNHDFLSFFSSTSACRIC